ncbi:hypothetical protein HT031_005097 [Scenedesmus sp. PABB004]|nr:hypothetical protein HT031_005097 [Scenedesmus sp. PABB004]
MAKATSVALALVALLALATTSEALVVRQVFVWGLKGGVGAAAGSKAVRIALYNSWNKVNANSVNGYWIGQQNDGLLFGAKDTTWGDIAGYTDCYKSFKVWEKNQPSYKGIPVTTRNRLVSYL